jgi:NO-binding membrane sensor protein with MHYT domain/DNA-binding LytR/AlgR family response regulator
MPVTHEPWLVALSLIVAIQGSFVGLSLAVQVGEAVGVRRRGLLAGAAISLAVAIWAMHFVGMLAARLPSPVDYLVLPTLLSFLICVIVVGTAVFIASAGPLTPLRLVASACLMGGGIVTMHYIGMEALHASAHMRHDPLYVASSMVVAIGASGLALWLAAARERRPPSELPSPTLFPNAGLSSGAPVLSSDLLAIVVAVVAFIVSGVFLLLLVPDRKIAAAETVAGRALLSTATGSLDVSGRALAASPSAAVTITHEDLGQGSFGPLGGAGAPRRRLARRLPVEHDGMTHSVAVDDIVAIHANAHYTYIFTGSAKLFCPLAIGDVESRLDGTRFARVHRSHIVNLDRVVGLKRSGDGGLVELATPDRYSVPVARSRVSWFKARIGSKHDSVAS